MKKPAQLSRSRTKRPIPDKAAQLAVESWPISRPKPYPKNARKLSDSAIAKCANSIKAFGFRQPIVVDSKGVIIAGHTRLLAAQSLGLAEVPVHVASSLTPAQVKAYRLADNRTAQETSWDLELLGPELLDLKALDFDLALTGFDGDELLAFMSPGTEGLTDPDDCPEPQARAISVPGDLWLLGEHRLLCGDSTSVDAVERLMAGEKADMVFTDPPYGIQHSGKGITAGGVKGNDFGEILGDADVSVASDAFHLASTQFPEATLIFWGANYYPSSLPNGFGWLVWDKQREGEIFSGAELAFVNKGIRLDIFRHVWHGMVKGSEHGQARIHPMQKPVALAEWCFGHYGDPRSVLDLFLGSGSTLIACEKTKRRCLGMELDPKYVDVICRRWMAHTGKTATLAADCIGAGRTFAELEAERKSKPAAA